MGFDGITIGPINVPNPFRAIVPESDPDDGFGKPFDAYLPQPLQVVHGTIEGAVRRTIDLIRSEERPTPDGAKITDPLARSREATRALADQDGQFGASSYRYHADDSWKVWRTEVWPLGQIIHGRIFEAMSTGKWNDVEALFKDLEAYRDGDGYSGGIGFTRQRYYDDNEWIGLAALQAFDATKDERYLNVARHTFDFVAEGESPQGGVYWYEQDKSGRHTCSTAPAAQFALRLFDATGRSDPKLLDFAKRQAEWLATTLRREDGLYGDNIKDDGTVERHPYSYNQGTPIGLDVQLYRTTGEAKYLARAASTARAAMEHYDHDGLWTEAPVFTAIYIRNLMSLYSELPDPKILNYIDDYLDRLWTEARNPETGLFDQGGVGTYHPGEPGTAIDQGGVAQLFAVRALPPDRWKDIT